MPFWDTVWAKLTEVDLGQLLIPEHGESVSSVRQEVGHGDPVPQLVPHRLHHRHRAVGAEDLETGDPGTDRPDQVVDHAKTCGVWTGGSWREVRGVRGGVRCVRGVERGVREAPSRSRSLMAAKPELLIFQFFLTRINIFHFPTFSNKVAEIRVGLQFGFDI